MESSINHNHLDTTVDSRYIERYDRQIRLWGSHGQNKCLGSKVCLINANSLGIEILKSLCLAGVGSFTILDSHKLTPEDIGCNLIHHSYINDSRAECVKSMMLDLNDQVIGETHPLESYLPHINLAKSNEIDDGDDDDSKEFPINDSEDFNDLKFWKQFNCVIASGFLCIDQINRLSRICWNLNIPLILCKSIGFFGSLRIQVREHLIIEAHPDDRLPNFNLDKPFDDLKEYFNSIELDNSDNLIKINSFPYVVIIYHYLKLWQKENNSTENRLPLMTREKQELKLLINEGLKTFSAKVKKLRNQDGQELLFENFIEASKAVNTCFSVTNTELPDNVMEIFNNLKADYESTNYATTQPIFWLIVKAIKQFVFVKNDNQLPISGSIPDMISSSEEYIRLQKIYSKKAKEDVDNIFAIVQDLTNKSNQQQVSANTSLYDNTKLIAKNIRDIRIVTTLSPIYKEHDIFKTCLIKEEEEEDDLALIGLCLKAMDIFFSNYGRLPGCQDEQVETDIGKLKDCVKQILGKSISRLKIIDQTLYELCRYGGAELHATSAFLGGCIGQEVIKLITNQYGPINDTLVYNAMTASTRSFKLTDIFKKS